MRLKAFRATVAVFPKELASDFESPSHCCRWCSVSSHRRAEARAAPRRHDGQRQERDRRAHDQLLRQFTRDTPPAQWGDTVNTVEALGYTLADALYWVDDYKTCYADERTFTRFLQGYSRGMGRGRLTVKRSCGKNAPVVDLLLSTGETTIEGEASILSRMLVLKCRRGRQRDPGGEEAGRQAEAVRRYLSTFTAAFIQWLARSRADAGYAHRLISQNVSREFAGLREKLQATLGRQANTGRMVNNWAVLVTVYQLLREFLSERDADDGLPLWQDAIVETVRQCSRSARDECSSIS